MRIRDVVENVRKTDGWYLEVNGSLRRGLECPLTAGTGRMAEDAVTACERATAVMYAADDCLYRNRHRVIRRYLLEAAGLKEGTP